MPRQLVWLLLALVLSACPASREKAVKEPEAIVLGSIGEPKRLIPMLASDSASGTISGWIFNGLVKYDQTLTLVGDLAESFEFSADCLTLVFRLRRGVMWQDGREFTASDVLFTYEKLRDPSVATPYSGDFERVERLEVLDPYTVRITYKEPFAPALESWGMGIIPRHLLEGQDLNTTEFNRKPIGLGPYRMQEWVTGQRVVLVANDSYFEGAPKIRKYTYRVIPDTATMFLELRASSLDYMGLTPIQYNRQTDTPFFRDRFNKFTYPAFGYTYLGYNLKDARFQDRRVRQALTYAIDKGAIITGVLLGLGRPATGPYPPESWAYDHDVKPYPHDPKKARQLLAEAGWRDTDGDGVLDKDGRPFAFTLLTNQGNDERRKTAEIIQQNLAEVGVKIKIRILEWQAFLHDFIDTRRFEAIILGWSLGQDPDHFDIWHSSKTKEGEFNFVTFQNRRVDALLDRGRRTCNREARRDIYQEVHRILAEEQPYTFLYYPQALPILHKRFRGVEPSPIGIWYNFPTWWVPKNRAEWYL